MFRFVLDGEMSTNGSSIRTVPQDLVDQWGSQQYQFKKLAYVLSGVDIESFNLAVVNLMSIQKSSSDGAVSNYVIVVDESLRQKDARQYIQLRKLASDHGIRIKSIMGTSKAEVEFHVFGLTEYDRVVYLDPRSLILPKQKKINANTETLSSYTIDNSNVDELFGIPPAVNFSASVAYRNVQLDHVKTEHYFIQSVEQLPPLVWHREKQHYNNPESLFNTELMVITPSKLFFNALKKQYTRMVHKPWYTLGDHSIEVTSSEVINAVVLKMPLNVIALPHKTYGLLSNEFRSTIHTCYSEDGGDDWDAIEAIETARVVHYADDPIPPPWQQPVLIDSHEPYNSLLLYCFDASFDIDRFTIQYPTPNSRPMLTRDCDSVRIWNWLRTQWTKMATL